MKGYIVEDIYGNTKCIKGEYMFKKFLREDDYLRGDEDFIESVFEKFNLKEVIEFSQYRVEVIEFDEDKVKSDLAYFWEYKGNLERYIGFDKYIGFFPDIKKAWLELQEAKENLNEALGID